MSSQVRRCHQQPSRTARSWRIEPVNNDRRDLVPSPAATDRPSARCCVPRATGSSRSYRADMLRLDVRVRDGNNGAALPTAVCLTPYGGGRNDLRTACRSSVCPTSDLGQQRTLTTS
jgi:hypothetical protein